MIIAVLGRDGSGKSTIADALGAYYADKGIAIVADTELTYPTLPSRGFDGQGVTSIGCALDGRAIGEVRPYLAAAPKQDGLFFAGTKTGESILSYQNGLESMESAQSFVLACSIHGTVILDVSGQRTDPFLPAALLNADRFVVVITPEVAGVQWYMGLQPLLRETDVQQENIVFIGSRHRGGYITEAEQSIGGRFCAVIPELRGGDITGSGKFKKAIRKLAEAIDNAAKNKAETDVTAENTAVAYEQADEPPRDPWIPQNEADDEPPHGGSPRPMWTYTPEPNDNDDEEDDPDDYCEDDFLQFYDEDREYYERDDGPDFIEERSQAEPRPAPKQKQKQQPRPGSNKGGGSRSGKNNNRRGGSHGRSRKGGRNG